MKAEKLLLMVLVLLVGMAVAAPAVTIQTPWHSGQPEENLHQIITAWGFPVDNNTLQHATPLENLPAGAYSISHYARYADMTQLLGTYSLGVTPPAHGDRIPDGGIEMLNVKQSGNWACDITFSQTSAFGFFDAANQKTFLMATQNQNSGTAPYHQASGLIFDLGEINPEYFGQYIIAFNDGGQRDPYGDLDYNDLVVQLHCLNQGNHVPLPGTLPLVGGGLLGLWMLGRYPRLFASMSAFPGHHPPKSGGST
ncbi:MAG: hypothetical protein ACLP2P_15650 [Desulfobaccales bacterium]